MPVLGHQQVFHRRHLLEQAHVLESPHYALAGDEVAGNPWISSPL